MRFWISLFVSLLAFASTAQAQSRAAGEGFDITAQNGIGFDAAAGLYRATGEVQLVAGEWVVLSDTLVARLNDARDTILSVEATGQVYVQRGSLKAQARELLVRPQDETIEMTGAPVNIQLGEDRLVSDGLVRLNQQSGSVQVTGDFVLVVEGVQMSGREAVGQFEGDTLQRFEALGDVRIEGDDWIAAAERVALDRATNDLLLEGAVALQQGGLVLSGNRVDYNLSTGSLSIDGQDNGRIRGALNLE